MIRTLFFYLIAVGLATAQTRPNPDSVAVAQAVESLRRAMIDPARATLERLALPELSYGHSSGLLENRAQFVEALTSGSSDFQTIDLSRQTISVVDQTAMVRHTLTGTTNNNNVPGQTKLSVLQIWVRQGRSWKLLARQAVKI